MSTQVVTRVATRTHARHIASKMAADLKRVQRIYQQGKPTDQEILNYLEEAAILLEYGCLGEVTYGFKQNSKWRVALKYKALNGQLSDSDDDPGGIRPDADVSGTFFTSFLSYSDRWVRISHQRREDIKRSLPIKRKAGVEPQIESGSWETGRNYQSGNLGVQRSMIRRN